MLKYDFRTNRSSCYRQQWPSDVRSAGRVGELVHLCSSDSLSSETEEPAILALVKAVQIAHKQESIPHWTELQGSNRENEQNGRRPLSHTSRACLFSRDAFSPSITCPWDGWLGTLNGYAADSHQTGRAHALAASQGQNLPCDLAEKRNNSHHKSELRAPTRMESHCSERRSAG